jgi:crotonobetainyl-CoA:carnitine CoA-transferase CaiB-like acyl-CoA transferase
MTLLKRPDHATDPRFAANQARVAHRGIVDGLVAEAIGRLDLDEASTLLDELGIAYGHINDMSGIAHHPGIAERNVIEEVENSAGVAVKTLVGLAERLFPPTSGGRLRPPDVNEDVGDIAHWS